MEKNIEVMKGHDVQPTAWGVKRFFGLHIPKMQFFGVVLYTLRVVRIHKNGNGIGVVFQWWHPVSWALLVFSIPYCLCTGNKITEFMPFQLSACWRRPENINRLEWL